MTDKEETLYFRVLHKVTRKCERYLNQRRAYDYPPTANHVVKHPFPVLGDVRTGSMFDPCVVALPGDGLALFVSRRSSGAIERWDSTDGINWNFRGVALAPACEAAAWDSVVNRPGVLRSNDGWQMWYTGQNNGRSAIGFATSVDGVTFKRSLPSSVVSPEFTYEGKSVMNPSVVVAKNGYRMWYAAGDDYEPDVICEARSVDGVNWQKRTNPVLAKGDEPYDAFKVGGCSVIELADHVLAMFYIGYQNIDVARVCLAMSDDGGRTWRRSPANPLIGPEHDSWDAHAVYKPSALLDSDGQIRVWYNARCKRAEYVGAAMIEGIGHLI